MKFVQGEPVSFEESLTCEFKEIRHGDPIQGIIKVVDEYVVAFLNEKGGSIYWGIRDDRVVTGVQLSGKKRDQLRQIVGQKISSIAPPIPKNCHMMPFHQVKISNDRKDVEDIYVVEVSVKTEDDTNLYLTESGDAYRKTVGGKKKLLGSELISALFHQLDQKEEQKTKKKISISPSINRRLRHIHEMIEDSRILWVDDNPGSTIYERTTLSALNIYTDVALSTEEATYMLTQIDYDLIISDIARNHDQQAGIEFLHLLKERNIDLPVIFYIGYYDRTKPDPVGSFAITNSVKDLFHYIFDALER